MAWCTHDRCRREELHEEHDDDFRGVKASTRGYVAGSRGERQPRTRAERIAKFLPRVVLTERRPDGPVAYVKCPECRGGGCPECQETGLMSLFRWHLWKRRC